MIAQLFLAGAIWLGRRGGQEGNVREFINEVQLAAFGSLNRCNPEALDVYFATAEEGAQAAGLAETRQAYKAFVARLPGNNAVQFHSFDITAVEVHEAANLARVTYRLHFSLIQDNQAIFSAKATQNLALLNTSRGWRISGGDAPQLRRASSQQPGGPLRGDRGNGGSFSRPG